MRRNEQEGGRSLVPWMTLWSGIHTGLLQKRRTPRWLVLLYLENFCSGSLACSFTDLFLKWRHFCFLFPLFAPSLGTRRHSVSVCGVHGFAYGSFPHAKTSSVQKERATTCRGRAPHPGVKPECSCSFAAAYLPGTSHLRARGPQALSVCKW